MMSQLAILTGSPAFTQPLHVGRPNVANRERFLERTGQVLDRRRPTNNSPPRRRPNGANRERFLERTGQVLDRRWLTNNGPLVQEFEQRIAAFLGVKQC